MKIDIENCRFLSGKSGIPLQFIIKEFQLFDVLAQIAVQTASDKKLVFKGGTALNKVYLGEKQRFSEDLDFDLINASVPETVAYANKLAALITGFEIGEFRRVRKTVMFECSFESPLGGRDHVRVDICGKKLTTADPLVIGSARSTFTDRSVTGFQIYSFDDLVARKLNALADRAEGKDIYDSYSAIDKVTHLKKSIEKALESEGKNMRVDDFLDNCVEKLRKVDAKKIRNLTNPLIPISKRPKDWKATIDTLTETLDKIKRD